MPPSAVAIMASRRSCCPRRPTRSTPRTQPPRVLVAAVPHERNHRLPMFVMGSPIAQNTAKSSLLDPRKTNGLSSLCFPQPLRRANRVLTTSHRKPPFSVRSAGTPPKLLNPTKSRPFLAHRHRPHQNSALVSTRLYLPEVYSPEVTILPYDIVSNMENVRQQKNSARNFS
jgi:hypothetical protein